MLGNLKPLEILLIVAVVVILFGAKKLPDLARSVGKSARILKSEAKAMKSESQQSAPADPPQDTNAQTDVPRTIQASPGDVTSARPVTEPSDSTKR